MKRGREEPPSGPARRAPGVPLQTSMAPRQQPVSGAQAQKLTTSDALSYLREVKTRFSDRKQVYDTFLDIMKEFKAQRIDTSGVIARVKQLFKGHRELILGFNTFLPKGYEIELARISDDEEEEEEEEAKQPVEFDQAISYVNKIKTRFANDEHVYKAFLEILNMYRKGQKTITEVYEEVAVLFRQHKDLLHEFTYFLPDNTGSQNALAMRQGGFGRPDARGPPGGGRGPGMAGQRSMGAPAGMQHSPQGDHNRNMHKRKAARRAEEGFRHMGEEEGGEGYGAGAGRARSSLIKELQFLERVKNRLRNRDLYADFLKCINMYSQEVIGRQELVYLVADILGRTPDLMIQFHAFVNACESMDMAELAAGGYGRGVNAATTNRDLLKAKLHKDKFMTKPLSELVAAETERITPSYVKIPPGYPKLSQAGITELGKQVLNDQYVNVITGSEDYSFKLMRKNQYEEALFRCEDDRYEFDIVMEQNNSTLRVLAPIVEKLADMSNEERAAFSWDDPPVEGWLSIHNAHVSRLYADQGVQILELLRKNPAVAVPVIAQRLRAKVIEWRKVKEEMTGTWKKIYEANYPRSLDHRSFYFKQQEKKCMMTKIMVSEVKEPADRRKANDAHLRNLSMAHRYVQPALPNPSPDLSYLYTDRAVFEDVYVALKAAIQQQLHSGVREQVLILYLQVIEPFLGLAERSDDLAKAKQEAEEEGGMDKVDADMDDLKSDSSEQEGATKATRHAEATPEPMDFGGAAGSKVAADHGSDNEEAEGEGTSAGRRVFALGRGGEGEEREAQAYSNCKPLTPWCGACASQHYIPPPSTRVMYGNENIYVFLRFHRYLYERLCAARKLCLEVATRKASQPANRAGGTLGGQNAGTAGALEPPSEASIQEEADRIHASFLQCLTHVLNNAGGDGFEDQVRNLLGHNSYELFTMDKLLNKLVKHMASMVSDDTTAKLWSMYKYELTRSTPVTLAQYHINCHTVLDELCYRVEFRDSDWSLRFQQGDAERSDAFLFPEGALNAYITQYVNNAAALPAGALPPKHSVSEFDRVVPLFQQRTIRHLITQAPDEALHAALQACCVVNNLECKVACATCKVSYVLDTEDVMVRRKRGLPAAKQERMRVKRSGALSKWMQARDEARKAQAKLEEEQAARILLAGA